jgi:cytochrome c-type biogenesis protein
MTSFDLSLGLALTAGSVAAFNPCGFAMLPAYLGWFVGDDVAGSSHQAVRRALLVSLAMTLGFVVVFGAVGLLVEVAAVAVGEVTPWLTLAIGLLLVPMGLAMALGRELKINTPRMQRGGADRGLRGVCLFGMSYATVSLSCTLPVFLTAVSGSFRDGGVVTGIASYLAYSAGMGLVVATLTVALALARDGVVRQMRRLLPYIGRISGVLLVVAGAYVAWYGYWELRVLRGDSVPEGPVAWVSDWSGRATERVDGLGVGTVLVALSALLALVAIGSIRRRRAKAPDPLGIQTTDVPTSRGGTA